MYIIVICTVLVSTLAFMYTCQALINKINTHTHKYTHDPKTQISYSLYFSVKMDE